MDLTPPVSIVGWIVLAIEIGLRLVALGVIPGNRRPSSGMAWLLLIMIEPVIGFLIFSMIGRTRLGLRRVERQREAIAAIRASTGALPRFDGTFDTQISTLAELNEHLGSLPLTEGSQIELLPDYTDTIGRMVEAVDAARVYVHIEFYITAWDALTAPLFDAMVRATERGAPSSCSSITSAHEGSPATARCCASCAAPRSSGTRCSQSSH